MDYEKKYNEALERAKKIHNEILDNEILGFPDQIREIFPELRWSEDERIRKWLVDYFSSIKETVWIHRDITCEQILEWLEKQKEQEHICDSTQYEEGFKTGLEIGLRKQKEQKEELVYRLNGLMQDYIKEGKDDEEKEHRLKCYQLFWDALEDTNFFEQKEQKPLETPSPSVIYTEQGDVLAEQKPASTEDMPYITDEHFYEREPADSFKYKLAEYMTRCCTKKEGPYGYTYGISAESILKMAEEELLKRGVVQKPAEWSEEDEQRYSSCLQRLGSGEPTQPETINSKWFKEHVSFRPSWKLSKDEERLINTSISFLKDFADKGYENAVECIDWLKSKMNGNSGK